MDRREEQRCDELHSAVAGAAVASTACRALQVVWMQESQVALNQWMVQRGAINTEQCVKVQLQQLII